MNNVPDQYLHGIEVVELPGGPRPIRTVKSSVIGLVGTAPEADATKFPLNTPCLVAGRRTEAAKLGTEGTLPRAIDGIFDQSGAVVVVIRVEEGTGSTEAEKRAASISNVIGGVDVATAKRKGLQVLLDAKSVLQLRPRVLLAPGFSQEMAVATEMVALASRMKAVALLDGPNTTDEAALAYRQNFGSDRAYLVDPWATVWDTATNAPGVEPFSPRVAGLISKVDNEEGFWTSPSNHVIDGVLGTARAIEFELGDFSCRANLLNEKEVATVIHEQGYRLWGNRTCATDPKFAFLCVRRTADMVAESLLYNHLWAVDRGITRTYVEDVREGVDRYLRHLKLMGAITGGKCWVDPEINSADQVSQGIVYWDYDFTPVYPAEHMVFRAHVVDDYIEDIFVR